MKHVSMGVAVTAAMLCAPAYGQTVSATTENSTRAVTICRAEVQRLLDSIRGNTVIVDWRGTWDYTTIQEALDASTDGDTIIVLPSDGSPDDAYLENIDFPPKTITLRSINPDDPTIVGATIIDGDAYGSVVRFEPGATADTVLDGFTVRNGQASCGGGIYCDSTSPTIKRCTIIGNSAANGGGLCCHFSHPVIDRCRINGNSADHGGGMHNQDSSTPTLTNCIFSGNEAVGCG